MHLDLHSTKLDRIVLRVEFVRCARLALRRVIRLEILLQILVSDDFRSGFDEGVRVSAVILMHVRHDSELHRRLRHSLDLIHELVVIRFTEILRIHDDKAIVGDPNGSVAAQPCDHVQPCLIRHGFDCGRAASCPATATAASLSTTAWCSGASGRPWPAGA